MPKLMASNEKELNQHQTELDFTKAGIKHKTEEKIDGYFVKPVMQTLWNVLFGTGIIIKETATSAAPVLGGFLFPLSFAIGGVTSIWNIYRILRERAAAKQKFLLGFNIVNLAGMITGLVLIALGIINPFAIPIIFVAIVGIGLSGQIYAFRETSQLIKKTQEDIQNIGARIKDVQRDIARWNFENGDPVYLNICLKKLQEKNKELHTQLADLQEKRFELGREICISLIFAAAVGFLMSSAVLTFAFPPAAAVMASIGFLVLAVASISSGLTSLSVRTKVKDAFNWCKTKLGFGKDGEEELLTDTNTVTAVDTEHCQIKQIANPEAVVSLTRRHSESALSALPEVTYSLRESKSSPAFFNTHTANAINEEADQVDAELAATSLTNH